MQRPGRGWSLAQSWDWVEAVRARIDIGLYVMVRPRGGDFLYSAEELAIMRSDIAHAARAGADGVVIGLLDQDGDVNIAAARELVELARPMQVTFHRAIDMTRRIQSNPEAAIESVIQTGVNRVLTSGGAVSAVSGAASIQRMVRAAADRVQVMVCGKVRAENIQEIVHMTGATQFHAAVRRDVGSRLRYQHTDLHLGSATVDDYARKVVFPEDVKALRLAMDAVDAMAKASI